MIIAKTILLIIVFANNMYAKALLFDNGRNEHTYKISIINKDKGTANSKELTELTLFEFKSNFNYVGNSQIVKWTMGYDDRKDWQVNMPAKLSYLNIYYRKRTVKSILYYNPKYVFPIYASDDIRCEIFEDSVRFSGNGSEKMNVQAKLFEMIEPVQSAVVAPPFDTYINQQVALYQKQLEYIESQKVSLSTDEYNYFKDQCYGMRNYNILEQMRFRLVHRKNDKSFDAKQVLELLNKEDVAPVHLNKLVATYLMDYLYLKEKMTTALEVSSQNLASELFKRISQKYSAETQYHLKMLMLTEAKKFEGDVFKEFSSLEMNIKNNQYANILTGFLSSLSVGSKAYEFASPDINGNIRRLSEFKGKVVIMDFWFTGCMPCLDLAKQMNLVMEELKGLDVAYITANADSSEDRWKTSIKKGTYTHHNSIDLYLGGFKTPMLKHYNITLYPRLIIIDRNGRIINSTPKTPVDEVSRQDFISLIKKHL